MQNLCEKIISEEEKTDLGRSSELYKIIQLITSKTRTKPKSCMHPSLFTLKTEPKNITFIGEREMREAGSGRDNNSIHYGDIDPPSFLRDLRPWL